MDFNKIKKGGLFQLWNKKNMLTIIKTNILTSVTYSPSYETIADSSDSMSQYFSKPEIWTNAMSSIETVILQILIGIAIFVLLQVYTDGMFTIAFQDDDVELKTTVKRLIAATFASTLGAIILFKMIIFAGGLALSMLNGGLI